MKITTFNPLIVTIDTGSSKFTVMVGPTGYLLEVSQHIKDRD